MIVPFKHARIPQRIIGSGSGGGKGGGGGSTPVEAPDTLQSVAEFKALHLISEGEIGGLLLGERSIFIDGVELSDEQGNRNFPGVEVAWRNGTQDQDYLPGFEDASTTDSVGVRVRKATPLVRAIVNLDADAFLVTAAVPALRTQSTTTGNITGAKATLRVEYQPINSGWIHAGDIVFDDKTASRAQKTARYELQGQGPWNVRFTRLDEDSTTETVQNETWVDYLSSVIDSKFTYPNSAVLGMRLDARLFGSSIPTVTFEIAGIKVRVPSNYDPVSRTYDGIWDGSFKIAVTDNPAWCFYDILIEKRYGLGRYIDPGMIPKEILYQIGRNCDELVDDGRGGKEPRFTLNVALTSDAEAYKVIQDLCSVFRGMVYWGNATLLPVQDVRKAPQRMFSPANVIGGRFMRSSSDKEDRHSAVKVAWNNPVKQFELDYVYVESDSARQRYGHFPTDAVAFGCTSEGQAIRCGRWILASEELDDELVKFNVGMEGALLEPGEIIRVSDPIFAGERMAGRVMGSSGSHLLMDAPVRFRPGYSYFAYFVDSEGVEHSRGVLNPGDLTTDRLDFLVPIAAGQAPMVNDMWMLAATNFLEPELMNVRGVVEKTKGTFEVTCVTYTDSKYALIDEGTVIDEPPTSLMSGLEPVVPTNFTAIDTTYLIAPGKLGNKLFISWSGSSPSYELLYRLNGGAWVTVSLISPSYEIMGVAEGDVYDFEIRAIAIRGKVSAPLSATFTVLGKQNPPAAPTNLQVVGGHQVMDLTWVNPPDLDLAYVQVYASETNDVTTAVRVGTSRDARFSHPLPLIGRTKRYYWINAVDDSGNVGPFNSNLGTMGETILVSTDDFTGLINADQLVLDLVAKIDSIPQLQEDVQNAVAADQALAQDLINQANAQAQALADSAAAIRAEAAVIQANVDYLENELEEALGDLADGGRLDQLANDLLTEAITRANTDAQHAADILANAQGLAGVAQDIAEVTQDIIDETNARTAALLALAGDIATNANAVLTERLARELEDLNQGARIVAVEELTAASASTLNAVVVRVNGVESSVSTLTSATALQAQDITALKISDGANTSAITDLRSVGVEFAERIGQLSSVSNDSQAAITQLERTSRDAAQIVTGLVFMSGESVSKISTLQEVTKDHALQLTTLTTKTGANESAISLLNQTTASQATQLNSLTTRTATNESGISTLNQTTADQALQLTQLGTRTQGAESNIYNLNQTTAAQALSITNLNTFANGAQTSIDTLNQTTATQATSITNLNAAAGTAASDISILYNATANYTEQLTVLRSRADGVDSSITTLNSTTAGHTTSLTNLVTRANGVDSSISSLSTTQAGLAQRVSNLEVGDGGALGARITAVENVNIEMAERVGTLSAHAGDNDAQLNILQRVTANSSMQLLSLNARSGENSSSITQLFNVTSDQASLLTTLTSRTATSESSINTLNQTTASQATQINSLSVRAGTNDSNISSLFNATANHTQQLTELSSRTQGAESNIYNLNQTTAAQAISISTLSNRVGTNESSISTINSVTAALAQRSTNLESVSGNLTSRMGTVESTSASNATRSTNLENRAGWLEGRAGNLEQGQVAQGTSITGLQQATIDLAIETATMKATSADTDAEITRVSKVTYELARTSQTLVFRTGATETKAQTALEVTASHATQLTSLTAWRADADSAFGQLNTVTYNQGQSITSLSSRMNGAEANVQTAMTTSTNAQNTANGTNGALSAQYSVKAQVDGYGRIVTSGFSLGVTSDQNSFSSAFYVYADRFAIISYANGVATTPFIVDNGQVFISNAAIGVARIKSANIESLEAGKISTSSLSAISANIGTVTAGILRNADQTAFIDLNAYGSMPFIQVGPTWAPTVRITADGLGYFSREVLSAPVIRRSGSIGVSISLSAQNPNFEFMIDTGYFYPSAWYEAPEETYISHIRMLGGLVNGNGQEAWIQSTVETVQGVRNGSGITNKVFIRVKGQCVYADNGIAQFTECRWKLLKV